MRLQCGITAKFMKGFTLIEIIIIFAISSVIVGISVNSFGNYNSTQIFNGAASDLINELNSARSRAISQVKPSQCSGALDGYEVKITTSSRDYEQSAICGAAMVGTKTKKLPSQVSFINGSAPNVLFNVSVGTVNTPRTIAITGFGKTSTIHINAVGIVSKTPGLSLISIPASNPIPPATTTAPTPTTGQAAVVSGTSFYSDGTTSKTAINGTTVTVRAGGAYPNVPYQLVAGTNAGNPGSACTSNITILNPNIVTPGSTGIISNTIGTVNLTGGTWQVCFRNTTGQTVTSPVTLIVP